jgi:hypothetical protein
MGVGNFVLQIVDRFVALLTGMKRIPGRDIASQQAWSTASFLPRLT